MAHLDIAALESRVESLIVEHAAMSLSGPEKRDAVVDALIDWLDSLNLVRPAREAFLLAILRPVLHFVVQAIFDRLRAAGRA